MAIQIQGNSGVVAEVDGTTFRAIRVTCKPIEPLGFYKVNAFTPTYAALAIAAPLLSFRWGNAANLAVIQKVECLMIATVAATTAGQSERELIIARSFTGSDTGGTAIVLTGNNNKLRTSYGTSLVTDLRLGGPLTAGPRTLDANPISAVTGWSGLNNTGVQIGNGMMGAATGAVWASSGGQYAFLLDAINGQDHPIILSQNEGIIGRIGKVAQPGGSTQQTYFTLTWAEVTSY